MKQYYIHLEDQEGPFSLQELKGRIEESTPVWCEGMDDWRAAGSVDELKGLFTPNPPAFTDLKTPDVNSTSNAQAAQTFRYGNIEQDGEVKRKPRLSTPMIAGITGCVVLAVFILVSILKRQPTADNVGASVTQPVLVIESMASAALPSAADAPPLVDSAMVSYDDAMRNAVADEPMRGVDAVTQKNMATRNNWRNYFKASTSTYYVGGMGGISDLTVYFDNLSDYTVDEMVVRVYYYKANGSLHGTNDAVVYSLTPGERKEYRAPDTGRGTDVKIEVVKVYSSKCNFLYSPDYNSGDPDDPYYYN